jgi:lysophospholipase L1-like esterase
MLTKLLRLSGLAVLALAATAWGMEPGWVGTWGAPAMQAQGGAMRAFTGMTLRQVVHISAGGTKVRIRFTNEFGTDSLTIADAHVALAAGGTAVKDDHKITFAGQPTVRIAQGAAIFSDPVDFPVPALSDLAISFYVPNQVLRSETYHALGLQTNYAATGDVAGAAALNEELKFASWYFISGVDVNAAADSRAIVTLGDSITDGARSTPDTNRRWPDVLAERLQKTVGLEHVSVLDEGISGNRILNEGAGPSALARLDRDVLAQDGVKYLIILESINDIGHTLHPTGPEDEITVGDLENVVGQIAEQAHLHGIKVYGATLTPYVGAGYAGEKGEQMREAYNNWIRTSGVFDAVIDFEKVAGDGATPPHFNPALDSGDHLHPGDAGYKAMGEAIDLNLFK